MTTVEIRCPNRILFGKLSQGVLEVKCKSQRCGARHGVVVLHQFDSTTGKLLDTKVYRDPILKEKNQ